MKSYSIPDLLVGRFYYPRSMSRKFMGGEINYAEKRDNVYLSEGYEAYAIRFRFASQDYWATLAVKVGE